MVAWLRRWRRKSIRPVATETVFEKPRQLRERHPTLYSQQQQFYRQDPATLGNG